MRRRAECAARKCTATPDRRDSLSNRAIRSDATTVRRYPPDDNAILHRVMRLACVYRSCCVQRGKIAYARRFSTTETSFLPRATPPTLRRSTLSVIFSAKKKSVDFPTESAATFTLETRHSRYATVYFCIILRRSTRSHA